MALWPSFVIAAATIVFFAEGRAISASEPAPLMMDSYGRRVLVLRDKSALIGYPNRAMMFAGYYRPYRRTNEKQVSGIYAQGNSVSGGSYLDSDQLDYPANHRIDESALSNAEASAAGNPVDGLPVDDEQEDHFSPAKSKHEKKDDFPEEGEADVTTELSASEDDDPQLKNGSNPKGPPKKQGKKKPKRKPIFLESEESDEDDLEDEDEDEIGSPFIPYKANRRRNDNPNLNNFFPMVFNYPRGLSRGGGSGPTDSPPGMITAIANSYSTGKGGVASSVATAYGDSPQGKKKRRAPSTHQK